MLKGVLPVLHMPYRDDFEIDYDVLGAEIEYAYSCGANGIVFALASELLRLDEAERLAVAKFMVDANRGRGRVIISVGAESTRAALRFARQAEQAGADALMAIPPLATAALEAELRCYYTAILEAVQLPLVVQDASSYVGAAMSVQFQAQLWREYGDRVLFKPEAAPVGPLITALHAQTDGKARILEGSGGSQLVENYHRSIAGTMPGVDLLDAIVWLWRSLQATRTDEIYEVALLVGAILSLAVGLDGYLAIEKQLMMRRGIFRNTLVRGPVGFTLDAPLRAELDRLFARLQAALGTSHIANDGPAAA